jgi:glycosyltransferase involved in cell wall biosynthesis
LAERLSCRTVVEIHDVLHLRQRKFEEHGYKAPVEIGREEELASLARFDAVVCINLDEASYLQGCGVDGVSYLPPTGNFTPTAGPPSGIVAGLIGSSALPNVDGLTCAIGSLRKLPHLVVAGSLSENAILDDAPGIERLGVLPDVGRFYSSMNVALSPVRFGGGLKIKVFEALANGKPVVATSHSVEGFPEGIRDVVRVEDDFATWNIDLLREAMSVKPSAISGYFVENFSPERCKVVIMAIL